MDILVIGEDGSKLGDMSLEKAKQLATSTGKSLILVNPKANVYRIADAGKLKYEQKQKEREQRAQKRTHKIKEMRFNLTTEQHDVDIKVRRIREFLEEGLKTKITMKLHGRQESLHAAAIEKINKVIEAAMTGGLATVDKGPTIEGKNVIVFLNPAKNV